MYYIISFFFYKLFYLINKDLNFLVEVHIPKTSKEEEIVFFVT